MTLKYVTAIVAQVPISQKRCWDKTLCVACQPFSDWAVQRWERVLGKEPRVGTLGKGGGSSHLPIGCKCFLF